VSEEPRDEAAPGAPKRRAEPARKRTVARVIATSVVVLALVTGLGVVYVWRMLNDNLTTVDVTSALGDDRPEEIYTGDGNPLDILVIGSDTRDGEGNEIDNEAGGGLSDTTILVHLSADRSRAYAISIPRDSIVERPDCGVNDEIPGATDKWNQAYAVGDQVDAESGGVACVMRQLEATTKIRVEHFIEVDFNGFGDMVDAVGGVPVCVPEDISDPARDIFVAAGNPNLLQGDEALDYVRARYIGTQAQQSDLNRIKRQQNFMAALVNKVMSIGTLTRLDKVVKFLDAATRSLTLDKGLGSVTKLGKLAMQLQNIGLDKVQFVTVPNAYFPRESEHWGSVYWTEDADRLWSHIRKDEPLPDDLLGDAIDAATPGKKKTDGDKTDKPDSTQSPSPEDKTPGLCD
jgi:LCP family protein required for cell wall assembly